VGWVEKPRREKRCRGNGEKENEILGGWRGYPASGNLR